MKVDKVKAFYTEEERITRDELDRSLDAILEESRGITGKMKDARAAGDYELQKEILSASRSFWLEKYSPIVDALGNLDGLVEQRYIESFNGNVDAILADVREIVDAIEKKDYLEYQTRRTENLRPLIDRKPAKGSPKTTRELYKAVKEMSVRGYTNCYYYILDAIRVQINALGFYESTDGKDQAIAIVREKTGQFYAKPKDTTVEAHPLERRLPNVRDNKPSGELLTLPSSPAVNLVYDFLGGSIETLQERKKRYDRTQKVTIRESGAKRQLMYEKNGATYTIAIDDVSKIAKDNPEAKKILTRIFTLLPKVISNDVLTRDYVTFLLEDLVGEGQYSNLETARQGFYNAMFLLEKIAIGGKATVGKRMISGKGRVLFKGHDVDRSVCTVYLNDRFDWRLIAQFFTGIPDYYYELPNRAADLLLYIFLRARQNTRQIAQEGKFSISYRSIQSRLNLPSEIKPDGKPIPNPRRDIKDAIENAIEQIEETNRKYLPEGMKEKDFPFTLEPKADYTAPIREYLDKGELVVHLNGSFAERFIKVDKLAAHAIDKEKKRQERIETNARAKALVELARDANMIPSE